MSSFNSLTKCHCVCQEGDAGSIADMLRATAEEAMTQTGFIFDETTGMYYDHSTGFYYDSVGRAVSCCVIVTTADLQTCAAWFEIHCLFFLSI